MQSSSIHPNNEDQEDAWSQNPTVHKHSHFFKTDELGQILSPVTVCLNKLCSTLMQLVNTLMTLKIILFLCLGLWEKKAQTCRTGLESKQNWNSVFHKARQIPVCQDAVEQLSSHGARTAS